MSWGAAAVAERWGGPWAQWFPYPLPVSSRDVPPFGLGLAPATGPAGRLRDRVLRPLLTGTMEKATLPELNVTREKLGVRPIENADELFLAAPLLLYMTAEPLEYPRSDWPESVRMVGPCSWDPPADPPAWLAEIDKPIVLVSTSSEFQDDGKLVTTALEALATEDVQVIATLPVGRRSRVGARQRASRAVRAPRADPRTRRVRDHARWRGRDHEGARGRSAGVRRSLRPRSA